MSLSKEEFISQYKLANDCIILEPWEDFSPAIETVLGGKRIIYDFNKLVQSLAESYRRNAKTPENPNYDYETQAIEWIDYNTMRSLPYWQEEFRPIVVCISKEELNEFFEQLYSEFDRNKIEKLMKDESFVEHLAIIRQFSYDEFDAALRKLLKDWLND